MQVATNLATVEAAAAITRPSSEFKWKVDPAAAFAADLEARDVTVRIVNAKDRAGRDNVGCGRAQEVNRLSDHDAWTGYPARHAGHWPCDHETLKCRSGRWADVHELASIL